MTIDAAIFKINIVIWPQAIDSRKPHPAVHKQFLARTNSQEIVVAKFEGEIIRLKELCTHMEIIVERLRRRPLFLYNKVSSK